MSDFKTSLKSSSSRLYVNIFGQVVTTFGQIAVVPLFLHYWTKLQYGEWLVLTAVPNLLWSLEGGFAGLATNQMVLSSAVGDWKGANRLFQNIVVIQMLVSALLILGGAIVVHTVNFRPIFAITEMSRADASFIIIVMLIYMSLAWWISLLRAPYFAEEQSARGYLMSNLWRLSDFVVVGAALVLHGSAPTVAVAQTINAAVWIGLTTFDIRRMCPKFVFGLRDVSWTTSKTVFRDGIPLFLSQAGTAFYLQGYPLVLSRCLGPLAVVNFSAVRTVTRVFLQVILMSINTATIELTTSFAKKNWAVYLAWVKALLAGVILGGFCTCVALYFAGPGVIALWTHGKVSVSGPLVLLFGISVIFQAMTSVFFLLLYTSNKHHLQCYLYFAVMIGALIVGDWTIGYFGFWSVPVIMIGADLFALVSCIHLCVRLLPEIQFQGLTEILWPPFYVEKAGWIVGQIRRRLAA